MSRAALESDPPGLWERLRDFDFDGGGAPAAAERPVFPFTARLARENGWRPAHAARVVDEYRRFLFLAMASGHVVTPSDAVDQAWHLHLVYTRSYWDALCRDVLGRPLHHEPTRGGFAEAQRHAAQYRATLASYRRLFGEEPPADIWPPPEGPPAADPRWRRVATARTWIVPRRPVLTFALLAAVLTVAGVLLAHLAACLVKALA